MKSTTRILVIVLCVGFSAFCSYMIRQRAPKLTLMCDFGAIYFGARCALQHQDPYNPNTSGHLLKREFALKGEQLPADPDQAAMARTILTVNINVPSTLFLLAPIALLPWTIAQNVWMFLLAGVLAFAAFLIWDIGADLAPDVWLLLAGFLLANCQGLLLDGNSAAIAVSLCVIAARCFIKDRAVLVGAALLAFSLFVKPHDSGLVWVYFLLSRGVLRKRALQTFAIAVVLAGCAAIWITPVSPHWFGELHSNMTVLSARGATNPGLSGTTNHGAGQIIDLQSVLSIFWDNPAFYSLATYFIIGGLILVWAITTVKKAYSVNGALLALAAISALSMLPVYHRSNDAKLLLLAIPACALLWTGRGSRRWIALALTSASIVLTSDIPLAVLGELTRNLAISTSTLTGKLAAILLLRPAPLVLLATGCFYLWTYLRYSPHATAPAKEDAAPSTLTADAAT